MTGAVRQVTRFVRIACRTSVLALSVVLAGCAGDSATGRYVVLATTTSVGNSGLLDALLPPLHQDEGLQVRSHLVGSGLALRMLERGDADIVISHSPAAEASAVRSHPSWRYRKLMFNDFVIVGPVEDPARVKGAADAEAAMQQIAASDVLFLSRGDQSGTHEREESLWRTAGVRPRREKLVVAGAGMGATLRIASEMDAYTLTDRATLTQHAGTLRLAVVFDRDPALVNTYAVIFDPSGPRRRDAEIVFNWLSDGRGRQLIDAYRSGGARAFFPWPTGQPREAPDALPR
jgi:tungstate transport system substrate-binding protein